MKAVSTVAVSTLLTGLIGGSAAQQNNALGNLRATATAGLIPAEPQDGGSIRDVVDEELHRQLRDESLWSAVIPCEYDNECGRGVCEPGPSSRENPEGELICHCDEGIVNNPTTGDACDYEQTSQLKLALLSWFVGGLGVDWFVQAAKGGDDKTKYNVAGAFKLLTVGGCGIWWLVDAIRITANADNFPDANGVPNKPF